MQRRITYLLDQLDLDPRGVPASNLVFVRSKRAGELGHRFEELAAQCWPFHQAVIDGLGVKVVLCLGRRATDQVRKQLGTHRLIDSFSENNKRKWSTRVYSGDETPLVIGVTHPSVADWTASATDPTGLIRQHAKARLAGG